MSRNTTATTTTANTPEKKRRKRVNNNDDHDDETAKKRQRRSSDNRTMLDDVHVVRDVLRKIGRPASFKEIENHIMALPAYGNVVPSMYDENETHARKFLVKHLSDILETSKYRAFFVKQSYPPNSFEGTPARILWSFQEDTDDVMETLVDEVKEVYFLDDDNDIVNNDDENTDVGDWVTEQSAKASTTNTITTTAPVATEIDVDAELEEIHKQQQLLDSRLSRANAVKNEQQHFTEVEGWSVELFHIATNTWSLSSYGTTRDAAEATGRLSLNMNGVRVKLVPHFRFTPNPNNCLNINNVLSRRGRMAIELTPTNNDKAH